MPAVFIEPPKIETSLRFRFADDPPNKKRIGNVYPIQTPEVRSTHRIHEYKDKKHHELLKALTSQLNWCASCQNQATNVLVFRSYYGVLQVQKFCKACADKNIIRL